VYPKTNKKFWKDKLKNNISRDKEVRSELRNDKWIVKTVWECEIEKSVKKITTDLINLLK